VSDTFHNVAKETAAAVGRPKSFFVALAVVLVWAITGPFFHYSNGWQLVINTGTTIVTFLMVFIIQNTQNRDSKAIQLKLDELVRATRSARNTLVDVESLSDEELTDLEKEFHRLRERAKQEVTERAPRRAEHKPDVPAVHHTRRHNH
jgi:low affinity Fe/Cu permease